MIEPTPDRGTGRAAGGPGWRTLLLVSSCYAACAVVATHPRAARIETHLPSLVDPLHHLWVMHWWKACLLEGQSPVLCPEIHHPVGAPMGNFSPLYVQSLLNVPLSAALANDVLCYNLLWFAGLVTTGLGTFALAWTLLRSRAAAGFAGLAAMLSTPVLLHARDHLDIIYAGGMPLFLAAWLRLVDRPGWGRCLAASGAYVLIAACHPYHMVFVTVPATLYLAWQGVGAARGGDWAWIRSRLRWALRFSAAVLPPVGLLYANHAWAMLRGYTIDRPLDSFADYGAPLWSYVVPTSHHLLGRTLLPFDAYGAAGIPGWTIHERASYLGVVTLGLVHYAAVRRVGLPGGRFWWAVLAVLAVLGFGAYWHLGSAEIGLPALWLKEWWFAFKPIRVPARFNLLAAMVAALIAAGGLRHLMARLGRRGGAAAFVGLSALMVADLAILPYPTETVPPMPGCYAAIKARDPDARLLEIPQYPSGGAMLTTAASYWQTKHRLTTSLGYSGQTNAKYERLVMFNSPFFFPTLGSDAYLDDPDNFLDPGRLGVPINQCTDLVHAAGPFSYGFDDATWLYMHALGYDDLIIHKDDPAIAGKPALARLQGRLRGALVYEDDRTAVYDRSLLPSPTRPIALALDGWRNSHEGRPIRVAERRARLAVFNPQPDRDLLFVMEAKAHRWRTGVRLLGPDGRELARWVVPPMHAMPMGAFASSISPPFRLPAGLQILTIESDRDAEPRGPLQVAQPDDLAPYSLRVAAALIGPAPSAEVARAGAGTSAR